VPPAWRGQLGDWLIGGGPGAVQAASSFGPTLSRWDGASQATLLVGYPASHKTLGDWLNGQPANPLFNMTTTIAGAAFVGDSVLVIGETGLGPSCYGTGADCGDLVDGGKGAHAYPYAAYVWAYDAHDLVSGRDPWTIVPYASGILPNVGRAVGACFDPATKRLYVADYRADGDKPLIHVFSVTP
jgi:hypothetical protein